MKRLLLWIGIIRIRDDGSVHWPVSISPRWMWRALWVGEPLFGVFRNRPGVVKWQRGRLLPRRWGIRIWFLEIGDRG